MLSISDSMDHSRLQAMEAFCPLMIQRPNLLRFAYPTQSCSIKLVSHGNCYLRILGHPCRKFCFCSPLGFGLGKLTMDAFVRMNFLYYFISSFTTTVIVVHFYSSYQLVYFVASSSKTQRQHLECFELCLNLEFTVNLVFLR